MFANLRLDVAQEAAVTGLDNRDARRHGILWKN